MVCSQYGTCNAGLLMRTNDSPSCAAVPAEDRRAAIIALAEEALAGDYRPCIDHNDCQPCGSYCDQESGGICRVECLAPGIDDPPAPPELGLTCADGEVCSPLGECVPAPPSSPPPFAFTIATSPVAIAANTARGPVVREVTVQLITNDITVLSAEHDAHMTVRVDGNFADGEPRPRMKCNATDELAETCVFAGGWQWNIASGDVRSEPRTVWIEIPEVEVKTSWTVEAATQWSGLPGIVAVAAEPVPIPATDPGEYSGTITFENGGAGNADNKDLTLSVTAIVTPTHVALLEPSRVILPAGQLVLARDAAKATMTPWLVGAEDTRYDVRFDLGALDYDSNTGRLSGAFTFATGVGNAPTSVALALERTGNISALTCTTNAQCSDGFHCETEMGLCLPGAASAGIIVDDLDAASNPSTTVRSALFSAWAPVLPGLISGSSGKLGGSGVTGFERAYCYESSLPGAARFGVNDTLAEPSQDRLCHRPTVNQDYPQTTFNIVNRDTQFDPDFGGVTFDLFSRCLADLAVSPTAPNPLQPRYCTSLAQFFLALYANVSDGVGQPMGYDGQRLVNQLLRQWLGVQAYVANTAIQVREYDDALAVTAQPAHARLGSVLDTAEQGLRVLLDPRVRAQYRSGNDIARSTHSPDYRRTSRPYARFTFNNPLDRGEEIEHGRVRLDLVAQTDQPWLQCNRPDGYAITQSEYHVDGLAGDESHFSIVAALGVATYPRNGSDTFTLFEKQSATDRLWVEAKTNNPGLPSSSLSLTLKDSGGGIVTFPPIPGNAEGHWGLIAIVANGASYTLYQQRAGHDLVQVSGQIVAGGGVLWGDDGDLRLRCDLPTANQCPSWHFYREGDYLGGVWWQDWTENPEYFEYMTSPTPSQASCNMRAEARRQLLVANVWPNPPPNTLEQLTVTTGAPVLVSKYYDGERRRWEVRYRCPLSIHYPEVPNWWKPVCGAPGLGVYSHYGIHYDEVSFWNRAISVEEFARMWERYHADGNAPTLPPPETTQLPGTEQSTALPVHMIEAASASLDLLTEYIEAERGGLYAECLVGGASPSRTRVLERAGRNLRLATVLEGEAVHLAELPNVATATWYERYQAARRGLAGRRTRALKALEDALDCKNPLGIAEEDVPLFIGHAVAADEKFFASTRFLIKQARAEVGAANEKLASARSNYIAQRQSKFQIGLETPVPGPDGNSTITLRQQRIEGLKAQYETVLRKACGALPDKQPLLPQFLSGELDAGNCFYRGPIENSACAADLPDRPIAEVPAECVRGEIGAQLLAVQAAGVDEQHAINAYDRAKATYEVQTDYCIRLESNAAKKQQLMARHIEHMKKLREERQSWGGLHGLLNDVLSVDFEKALGQGFTKTLAAAALREKLQGIDNEIQDAEWAHAQVMAAMQGAEQVAACYHQAELLKFSIDAQRDVMKRAALSVAAAMSSFDSNREILRALVDEAAGQIAIESRIDRAPPQFHYWLHEDIEQLRRHMEHARRLTYLALRAFEYESQSKPPLRDDVLNARVPDDLAEVLYELESHSAPVFQGYTPRSRVLVLSLRDELLRLKGLSGPGGPDMTPTQVLREYLLSDSARIYDENHKLVGRGVRFSLKPAGFSQFSCAERIWRVTVSLQVTGSAPTERAIALRKMNAFGSQQCGGGQGGDLHITRAQPSSNLLLGEKASVSFVTPKPYTSITVGGPLDLDREAFENAPEHIEAAPGLAGRGLYGDYVLVFGSKSFTPEVIENTVEDVLIRFDMVELTDD